MRVLTANSFCYAPSRRAIGAIAMSAGLLLLAGCRTSRIGGTYIARTENLVSMLQLTQTDAGRITGAIDEVVLRADGKLQPGHASITGGTLDGNQLTLVRNSGFLVTSIAGTLTWSGIHLQEVGSNADAISWDFHPGSADDFKSYADELKLKAQGTVLSATLLRRAQQLRQIDQSAEKWMADAEQHSQKLPGVKTYYQKLEAGMRALVTQEHVTRNFVERTELSVKVIQANNEGTQADLQVGQMWDRNIGDAGRSLHNTFASAPSDCGIRRQLQKRGAITQAIDAWESACRETEAERRKFEPVFKRIMDQRADLKAFQSTAESHRRTLVAEAERVQ